MKRILDVAFSLLGLLMLSPLMLLIAFIICLESRGPVFFRQERKGLADRTFRIWKFRTMNVNSEMRIVELESQNESPGGVLFKIRCDPRITRFGRILRRTSLDELPQFFNVLLGQMSLVGPRPLPLRDCARLEAMDGAGFSRRHEVIPGITCLWQVSGRSRLGAERMIALDCEYIENWSLWLDLTILARTFGGLLSDFGGSY